MEYRDLVKKLEESGDLRRITRKVDPKYEMAAIMKRLDLEDGPAVLFENIGGHKGMSVVGNLYSSRRRIAFAMGTQGDERSPGNKLSEAIARKFAQLTEEPGLCQVIESGAIKDVIYHGEKANVLKLPVLTHCEKDGGPYISAGVVISKDPETKKRAIQVIEIQVKSDRRLTISPVCPPIVNSYAKAEAMGKSLETAIIGAKN